MMIQHTIRPTQDVRELIPGTLAQYLCGLAEAAEAAAEGKQTFALSEATMGSWAVQDILHFTDRHPDGTRYRVFGFAPVEATLHIEQKNGDWLLEADQTALAM